MIISFFFFFFFLDGVIKEGPWNVCDNPLQTSNISLETYHHQELTLASKSTRSRLILPERTRIDKRLNRGIASLLHHKS